MRNLDTVFISGGNWPCQLESAFQRTKGSKMDHSGSRLFSAWRRTWPNHENEETRGASKVRRQSGKVLQINVFVGQISKGKITFFRIFSTVLVFRTNFVRKNNLFLPNPSLYQFPSKFLFDRKVPPNPISNLPVL